MNDTLHRTARSKLIFKDIQKNSFFSGQRRPMSVLKAMWSNSFQKNVLSGSPTRNNILKAQLNWIMGSARNPQLLLVHNNDNDNGGRRTQLFFRVKPQFPAKQSFGREQNDQLKDFIPVTFSPFPILRSTSNPNLKQIGKNKPVSKNVPGLWGAVVLGVPV